MELILIYTIYFVILLPLFAMILVFIMDMLKHKKDSKSIKTSAIAENN